MFLQAYMDEEKKKKIETNQSKEAEKSRKH